jgi:MFS family permease
MTDGVSGPTSDADDRNVVAILPAMGLAIIAVLPAFLTGSLAVGIRAEFGFGPAALGLAVAWYFVASSVGSTFLGQVVERLGTRSSLTIGAAASATALGGLAASPQYGWLLVAMTIGGAGNAITQPAVAALLSGRIPAGRLGLAFGIKQAAIPMASLIGGLTVPTLAVLVGWRGTFTIVAGFAAVGAVVAWRVVGDGGTTLRRPPRRLRDLPEVASLVILSFGGLLGAAAATSLGVFVVDAAVVGGMDEGLAGLLIAVSSACGLTARISLGWHADRYPKRSRYGTIGALLATGVVGYGLLSTGFAPLYVVGSLLAYGAGWAWPGLFHYAVVSQNPATPAAATGVLQSGMSLGAGVGPLVFGFIAERFSYEVAWLFAGGLSAAAATVFLIGREHLRRSRRASSAAHLAEVTALIWDDASFGTFAEGVRVQERITENLRVTLYQADPGTAFDPPPPPRTGVVLVVAGGRVQLRLAGVEVVAAGGEHFPLPGNRTWSVSNDGLVASTLAQVEYRGMANGAMVRGSR